MPDVAGLIADHHLGLSHDVGALGRCEKMRRQNPEPKNAPAEAPMHGGNVYRFATAAICPSCSHTGPCNYADPGSGMLIMSTTTTVKAIAVR